MSDINRIPLESTLMAFPSEYITQEDLTKAARKLAEAKKHESKHNPHFTKHVALTTVWFPSQVRVRYVVLDFYHHLLYSFLSFP